MTNIFQHLYIDGPAKNGKWYWYLPDGEKFENCEGYKTAASAKRELTKMIKIK